MSLLKIFKNISIDKSRHKYEEEIDLIKKSGLFDEEYYVGMYPDVKEFNRTPLEHYIQYGFKEKRRPSFVFNSDYYLMRNKDVASQKINPLVHWIKYGQSEGRESPINVDYESLDSNLHTLPDEVIIKLSGLFDRHYYLERNPDVEASGMNAVQHYLLYGNDGRRPSAHFDSEKYLRENPDVKNAGLNPLRHWILFGSKEPNRLSPFNNQHAAMLLENLCSPNKQELSKNISDHKFFVSIITATFNTPSELLRELYQSIKNQNYSNWEWVVVDDGSSIISTLTTLKTLANMDYRIQLILNSTNVGISEANNKALSSAKGNYVALVDHDDLLPRNALLSVYQSWQVNKCCDVFYTDECKLSSDGGLYDFSHKPGYSPALLENTMYIGHLTLYRTKFIMKLGGFRKKYDGTQDYDLALRAFLVSENVCHVPEIGYIWRALIGSTALSMDEKNYVIERQRQALVDYAETKISGSTVVNGFSAGYWRIHFNKIYEKNKVSFIIPTAAGSKLVRGKSIDLLQNVVESIEKNTLNLDYEIIVVHNGNLSLSQKEFLRSRQKVVLIEYHHKVLNLSSKINIGASKATGDFLCLMNDDIEFITPNTTLEIISFIKSSSKIGVVGPLCLYEDGKVQHNGIVLLSQGPSHLGIFKDQNYGGMNNFFKCRREVVGVTGAIAYVTRSLFDKIGGFSEELPLNYNDIDFCLRILEAGYSCVVDPFVKVYHFESATKDGTFKAELQKYYSRNYNKVDPYFNKNLFQVSPYAELPLNYNNKLSKNNNNVSFESWLHKRISYRILSFKPNHMPKLSVCVSVYNQSADLLQELFYSFRMQSYENKELILVNNGSTNPDTLNWLARQDVQSISSIITLAENQGIMGANRALLKASSGEYILPVDADDFLTIDALQIIAYYIENHKGKYYYSDEFKSDIHANVFSPFFKPDFDPILISNCCYPAHLMAFERKFLMDIGAYSDDLGTWSHDYDTITRAMVRGEEPVHIPELLYAWRIVQGSTASAETGAKPGTIASQKFALERLITSRKLEDKIEIVSNNLIPNSGMWQIKSKKTLESVHWISIKSLLKMDEYELVDQLLSVANTSLLWLAFEGAELDRDFLINILSAPIHFDNRVNAVSGITLDPAGVKVEWSGGFFHHSGVIFDPYSGASINQSGYHGQLYCQRCVDVISPFNSIVKNELVCDILKSRLRSGSINKFRKFFRTDNYSPISGLECLLEIFLELSFRIHDEGKLAVTTPYLQLPRDYSYPVMVPVDRKFLFTESITQRKSRWYSNYLNIQIPYHFV